MDFGGSENNLLFSWNLTFLTVFLLNIIRYFSPYTVLFLHNFEIFINNQEKKIAEKFVFSAIFGDITRNGCE